MADDERLVAAYQAGDQRAFVELAERWEPWARTLASRHMGTAFPFETLRQDALIGLWKAARRFDTSTGRPFNGYAATAMLNQVRATLGNGHRWLSNVMIGLDDDSDLLGEFDVEVVALGRITLAAVVEAIDAMSPARREVMRLAAAGYPPRDIARVLDKNLNTVARHLQDGREQLRRVA